jgi:hypothetical protein
VARLTRRNEVTRTAKTKDGTEVILNKTYAVDGGWIAFVMHSNGYAVEIFVPGE